VNIRSMCLIDTNISKFSMKHIVKAMDDNTKIQKKKKDSFNPFAMKNREAVRNINALCFKHCYLGLTEIRVLTLGIKITKTLLRLDLSSNAMNSVSGAIICDGLKENNSLIDINLARNLLCDYFAECLANTLRLNNILWRVDISDNKITSDGA